MVRQNQGITIFNIFIWEVYRRIYGQKFSASGAVKRDFQISPKENFEYGYPNSNALLFPLKLERCKPHKATRHQTKWRQTISDSILSQIFDVIQSDIALQKQVHYNV